VRAWTTAKVIANEIGYPREFLQRDNALYLASVNGILDVIVSQDGGFNNLMLVGHNPGFTDFANYLVPGVTNNMPTAGVVSVELDTDDWSLYDRPGAKLLLYDFPKNRP
jgi:phosphohistidine phosphatase